jgi:L-lactate dehydrogenase complex protein LldE
MADVLERIGYQLDFPENQTCCGQPAFNSGYHEPSRQMALHFMDVFKDADYVVVPSGSCTAMITHHYEELHVNGKVIPRVWEFSKFLLEVAGVDNLGARFDGVVTYHDSCHGLRELGTKAGPRRLLANVKGLELREMDIAEECCGFGGTFSVKFPEVSGGMARTKIESVLRTKADTIVGGDCSCLMQLQGAIDRAGLPLKTMHIAEILASQ